MSIRTEKVASVIKRALAGELSAIAGEYNAGLVTITAVRMSKDLAIAKVYLSLYAGKMSPGDFLSKLEDKKYALRSFVGSQIRLRHTPEVRFYLDDTLDQIEHIQQLINSIDKPIKTE